MSINIEEIVGVLTPTPYQSPNTSYKNQIKQHFRTDIGPQIRYCSTLEPWQRNIVDSLSKGQDQYIIARPGGGKTLPIICYWLDRMLSLNVMKSYINYGNPNINNTLNSLFEAPHSRTNQPKLIFLVPIITLANQTSIEIRKDLSNIMLQAFNSDPDYYIGTFLSKQNPTIAQLWEERRLYLSGQHSLNNLRSDNTLNYYTQTPSNIQQHVNSINSGLIQESENTIRSLINNMVYIRTGSGSSDIPLTNALVYVSIYESAMSYIKNVENPKLLVLDESHLIQESGNENDENSRSYQIAAQLHDILSYFKNLPDTRLVLLSGTINPKSAKNVTDFFNACYERNFQTPVEAPSTARNRSMLSVLPNESIKTNDGIVKNIVRSINQNDWGQLYVLFSTNRITQIVKECINNIGNRNIENTSSYNFDQTFNRNQNQLKLPGSSIDIMSIPSDMRLEVSNITNPLLRQAVLRGIGFIYRNIPGNPLDEQQPVQMNDQDKQIVAKLFRDKKINVLLATDAVGIGVNIDVKDLYIPEVIKYNSKIENMISVTIRDLSQILNRAGRGATPIASIHTPSRNIEIITNALYAGSEDLPIVSAIKTRKSLFCNNKFLSQIRKLIN